MTIPTFPSEALFPANAESMPTFPASAAHAASILTEDGSYVLAEDGSTILEES